MVRTQSLRWCVFIVAGPLAGCAPPEDPPPSAGDPVPAGLSVVLTGVTATTNGPNGRGVVRATVRFRNGGPDAVWVLKPLDGSHDGRLMPFYDFQVDGPGLPLEPGRRCAWCGKWADTEWPRDYLLEVPAGGTVDLPNVVGARLPGAGRFTLRFEYTYLPRPGGGWGEDLAPPEQAWRGKVAAPVVELDYRPDPAWRPPEELPPELETKDEPGLDRTGGK